MPEIASLPRSVRTNTRSSIIKTSLLVFCSCLVGLTVIAWGISFFCRLYLHLGFPFSTPLFDPAFRFSDLTDFYPEVQDIKVGSSGLILNYPAPALYVYVFFIRFFPNPVI